MKRKISASVWTIIEIVILMNVGDAVLTLLKIPSVILLIAGALLVFFNTMTMKQPDGEDEIWFAVMQIVSYVIFVGFADKRSLEYGMEGLFMLPMCIVLLLMFILYMKKHGLMEYYGFRKPVCSYGKILFFLPMIVAATVNIWGGLAVTMSVAGTIVLIFAKALAGVVEEFIFRGFLFKGMSCDDRKSAIIVTSLTFGLGHIANLLRGAELLLTLVQIAYATAIGFMLAAVLVKTGSIIPGIIFHAFINGTSAIRIDSPYTMVFCAVLTVICAGYAIYLFKAVPENEDSENT